MVDIQSKEAIDKMSEELKVQPAMTLPRALVNNIQPVFEIGAPPRSNFVESGVATAGTNVTVLTTDTRRDTYITAIIFSLEKDGSADNASVDLRTTMNGATQQLSRIVGITLTAKSEVQTLSLPFPLKIDRGVAILITGANTVGVIHKSAVVYGFTTDPQ